MKNLGFIIIVIGVLMIVFNSIHFQTKKKVLDAGPIQIDKKENRHIGWPVYTGVVVCVIGVVVVLSGRKKL